MTTYTIDWPLLGVYTAWIVAAVCIPYWVIRTAVVHAIRQTDEEWEERNR